MRITLPIFALFTLIIAMGCSQELKKSTISLKKKETRTPINTDLSKLFPLEFVGEWASPDAKFDGEQLVKGGAVYLGDDGFAAVIGTPPPIGMVGTASYDSEKSILILNLHDNGTTHIKITFIYNQKAKTLTSKADAGITKETFKHRRDKVPGWVLKFTK